MSTLEQETSPRPSDVMPLLVPALLMFFLGMFGPPFFASGGIVWTIAGIIICQVAAVALGILFASQYAHGFRLIGLERAGLRRVWLSVLVGFIIVGSITYLTNLATQLLLKHFDALPDRNHPMLEIMQSGSPIELTLAIVAAVLVAPVFEEVLFRGHFQPLFASMFGRIGSILATSVLFTILHPWWTMPAIFLLSVMMCLARLKWNNTWAPLGIHVLFNLTSTVLFLIGN